MHPEMSLVILTVFAGAGQGIFIVLVILDAVLSGNLPWGFFMAGGITSILFQFFGMAASFFHLGNAQKGWKAILMWKSSWLSREVISLSIFVALALLYLILYHIEASEGQRLLAGFAGIFAAIGFYISSSMVYASIRYIKEWSNVFTPVNFTLLGITAGTAVSLVLLHLTQADLAVILGINKILIVLTIFAFFFKMLAFRFNTKAYVSVNAKNALGINDPNISMIDQGAAYNNYNTVEYYFPISESSKGLQEKVTLALAFVLPLFLWLFTVTNPGLNKLNIVLTLTAAILMLAGLVIERRLFFIEGNHLQNLYYGSFHLKHVKNPLLSQARKGTPVP